MDKKLWVDVEDIQKDFEYIQCHATGAEYPQHWICRNKNKSSSYCFEIMVGKYSISANGDIGGLSWCHSRNFSLLAGDDIDYYIYSKLDSEYKNIQEFDPKALEQYIVDEMAGYIEEISADLHKKQKFNKMAEKELGYKQSDIIDDEDDRIDELEEKAYEMYCEYSNLTEKCNSGTDSLSLEQMVDIYVDLGINDFEHLGWEVYNELSDVSDIEEFYDKVTKIDGLNFEFSERSFTQACSTVLFKLYMVCYAARKIIGEKNEKSIH